MSTLIAAAFFQMVFGSVQLGSISTAEYTPVQLTSNCSTTTQAAFDDAAVRWSPFDASLSATAVGDGCAAANPLPPGFGF